MGALDMVSCGMVDLTTASERDRRAIQTAVKFEAHAKGYWISGCKSVGLLHRNGTHLPRSHLPRSILAGARGAAPTDALEQEDVPKP